MKRFCMHFCRGQINTAFVFSAPGNLERKLGRPVAGQTGINLEWALVELSDKARDIFPSLCRYDYRITNAYRLPLARNSEDGRSEGRDVAILDARNVERVVSETDGCSVVVLCGKKAQLLKEGIQRRGVIIASVCHVGNVGLNRTYTAALFGGTSEERRKSRIRQWVEDILRQIPTSLR